MMCLSRCWSDRGSPLLTRGVVGDACQTLTVPYDEVRMHTFYDDAHWEEAVLFSEEEVRHNGNGVYDIF